ncbi:RICIN domain-containing protein [Kitasatospora viridis]|uniref:Ricin-type beta-trefoil lectin protein n=1 Tax=Kitasatospora viridis TaxID=281105 RepID=A0A561SEP8_9ACTN|nr:ricin-type beta-trefoil lectin domain protein [Kitasatospora viridis]TWF73341.1 ricin-type beta-trefoil lectin protein [Kitasatospora viridis]
MRRTAAVLMTTLLASAAALTAPAAAQAAAPSTAKAAPASTAVKNAPAAPMAGSCNAFAAGGGTVVGICTGIAANQIWHVQAQCQYYINGNGPFTTFAIGGPVVGPGQSTAQCGFNDTILFEQVVFTGVVPPPVSGPQGQITGYVGKCIDDQGANTANGTPIQIYDCNGTNAQHWTVATDGTLRVLGKCMDVTGGGTANHTMVQLYDCNGTGSQQWKAQANGSLVNPQSGRCLDDLGFGTNNGNQLGIWDCNGAANQVWNLPH